ncbi:MAG: molybdopterin-dependent oxidoreductase [Candidatus Wallbacteria bacterium]|nr:molybdopterin-dependent oxidoreductase [Candidatus Wallbacteria bacterium]
MKKKEFRVVGKSVHKIDGLTLACGLPKFAEDMPFKDPLYGKILASPFAHAIIKEIDTSKAEKLAGVHKVFTYKNVPRHVHTTAGQGYPEPSPYDTFILDKKMRFVGDRVAAVVADTPEIAEQACRLIKVKYKELPAILDPRKAQDTGAPVIHDEPEAYHPISAKYDPKHNLAAEVKVCAGDLKKGEKQADVVIEDTYYAHYAQHCPIEPHICCGELDHNNRILLYSSTQVPFHARRITAQALGIPLKRIRVVKPRIGGGFGTKQEVLLEDLCALMVLETRRPVIMKLTRPEEFISRTRHPMYTTIKAGVKKNGDITLLDMRVLSNTGAYGSHALTVMSNAGSKVLPLYPCDNVNFHGQTVYTNLPVGGAYRGYGATQSYFAMECIIDDLACAIGMDPAEFRLRNHIKENQTSPIFKALGEGREGNEMYIRSCGLTECIKLGMREIGWKEKRKKKNAGRFRRGVGMCALMQGSSIPDIDMGAVFIKINDDGSFNMNLGATDLGTGSDTIFAQMAAEVLGVEPEDIIVYSSDTDMTPFDVGAYASSTTYLSGQAVIKTAEGIRDQILNVAKEILGLDTTKGMRLEGKAVHVKGFDPLPISEIACHSLYSHNQHQIQDAKSHITKVSPPPFSAHFAEVEVDTWTGQVKVLKYVAAIDCGTAINPQLAEGQTEGAVANGISYAMWEQFVFNDKGKVLNNSFGNYHIMRTVDMPEIKTILVPTYEPTGPFGAKSVSEISINGGLPAISNAILHATGIRMKEGPFTPDRVYKALKKAKIV